MEPTLSDGDEVNTHGTDPLLADTDHDGMPDEWEEASTSYTQPDPETQPGLTVSTGDKGYTGFGATHFTIEIDGRRADGTNTFRWATGGLRTYEDSAIEITGQEQDLGHGIKVRFDSKSGHAIRKKWTFSALELNKYFDDSHVDADGDNRTNLIEYLSGTNPIVKEPAPVDSDGDGLLDLEEVLVYDTLPNEPDSDGDGLEDAVEVHTHGTLDGEQLRNLLEEAYRRYYFRPAFVSRAVMSQIRQLR